jgi:hypothetical protein
MMDGWTDGQVSCLEISLPYSHSPYPPLLHFMSLGYAKEGFDTRNTIKEEVGAFK